LFDEKDEPCSQLAGLIRAHNRKKIGSQKKNRQNVRDLLQFCAADDADQHANDNPATNTLVMSRQFMGRSRENANPPAKIQMGLLAQDIF